MRRFTLVMVVTLGFFVVARGGAGDGAKKELQSFEGTWVLISTERDGKTESAGKGTKLTFMGTKFSLSQESSATLGLKGTYSFDSAKKPKTKDIKVTEGPDKGKTFLAIYELSGDDYKICIAPADKERPKDFTSTPGSGNRLQTWKREKK